MKEKKKRLSVFPDWCMMGAEMLQFAEHANDNAEEKDF